MQTFEETERRHWANMQNEWERDKQKILTALVGTGQDMLDFPQESQVMRPLDGATSARKYCQRYDVQIHT